MIYFVLNFSALVIIFLFFNKKINEKLSLAEIKFEINESINLFNRNLEEKILKVENEMSRYTKHSEEIEKKSLKLKKLLDEFQKVEAKVPYLTALKPKRNLEHKPNEIKIKKPKNESLYEKILNLRSNGLAIKEIAYELSITTDEVKLNLVK